MPPGPQPPALDLPPWFIRAYGGEIRARKWRQEPTQTLDVEYSGMSRLVTLIAERYGKPNNHDDSRTGVIVRPHPRDRDWLFSFEREHLVA